MGVITKSDELIADAKNHLRDAINHTNESVVLLIESVNYQTWGSSDYSDVYRDAIEESINKLNKIRRKLVQINDSL